MPRGVAKKGSNVSYLHDLKGISLAHRPRVNVFKCTAGAEGVIHYFVREGGHTERYIKHPTWGFAIYLGPDSRTLDAVYEELFSIYVEANMEKSIVSISHEQFEEELNEQEGVDK